ncbi:MAG: hypothetical protein JW927_20430 [Deltaproteobacteria bacterium]|nr:hypothetical protein [Deltaproteobacteria bacterium]
MEYKEINDKQIRDTGMALTLCCLIISYLFAGNIFISFAILFLVVTMTMPVILKPLAFLWLNLSYYMGTLLSKVILTVIFFVLVVPTGIMLKIIRKDPMCIKKWKDGNESSGMAIRDHIYSSKDLDNPF